MRGRRETEREKESEKGERDGERERGRERSEGERETGGREKREREQHHGAAFFTFTLLFTFVQLYYSNGISPSSSLFRVRPS